MGQLNRVKIVCESCGREFEVFPYEVRNGRRYCSRKCANLRKRKRVERICENCGKEFVVLESDVKSGRGKFCSKECCWEYMKRRIRRVCEYCGKEFEVPRCVVESGGKFCSKDCLEKYYEGKRVKKICQWCGKEFEVWKSRTKGNVRFCSRECYRQYSRSEEGKRQLSENSKLNWQDPEFRKRQMELRNSPEYRKKQSERHSRVMKMKWSDPEYRQKILLQRKSKQYRMKLSMKAKEVGRNPELRKKRSLNAKRLWQNSGHRERCIKKVIEAQGIRPNGLEKAVCDLLQSYFVNEWSYVGDGRVVIDGYVPDFIHKEERWIIEVNGDYWHSLPKVREKDKRKREAYERCGYRMLEVWENEVRTSPMVVVSKVLDFFYGAI